MTCRVRLLPSHEHLSYTPLVIDHSLHAVELLSLRSLCASMGATRWARKSCRGRHGKEAVHLPMKAAEGSSSGNCHSGFEHCSLALPRHIHCLGKPMVDLGGYTEISEELCLGICMQWLWETPLKHIRSTPILQQRFILSY